MTDNGKPFQPIANPYIVGNPIEDRRMFYGREDDFGYIKTKVTGSSDGAMVVLCGTRRAGKTSILLQILHGRLGADFLPVLIDLQMLTVGNDIEFIDYLAGRIIESASDESGDLDFDHGSKDYAVVSRTFLALLKRLSNGLKGKSLVLMFDEYEIFETNVDEGKLSPKVLHLLGEIIGGEYGVHIVFAGSDRIEDRKAEYWASSLGKSLYRRVSFLSRDDTMRLIREPVRDSVRYEEGIPESILDLAAGQPFYTQVICQALIDLLNEQRRHDIGADDLDEVVQGIVENPLPHMVFTFEGQSDVARIALAALAELNRQENLPRTAEDILSLLVSEKTGVTLETDKLHEALERLFQEDLLYKESDGEHYCFKMDLWRRWVGRMHSIWQVLDEVLDDGRKPDDGVIRIARRRLMRTLMTVAALVAITAVIWTVRYTTMGPDLPQSRDVGWELTHTPLTGDGKAYASDISGDGRFLVYAHNEGGRFGLRHRQVESGLESVVVPADQQRIRCPVIAPDGESVFYTMAGAGYSMDEFAPYDLHQVPIDGELSRVIATGVLGRRIDCSPGGDRLVYMKSAGDSIRIMVSSVDGSGEECVAVRNTDPSVRHCLAWSVDGLRIYSTAKDTASGFLKILATTVTDRSEHSVGDEPWQVILDLHALADGSGLLIVGLPATNLDNLNTNLWLLPTGESNARRLTNDLTPYYRVAADDAASAFVVSHYAFKRNLRVLGVDSPDRYRDISTDIVPNSRVVWAEQGRLLANQRMGNRVGLVYMDTDGDPLGTVTTNVPYVSDIAYYPPARQLAYTSFVGRDMDIWLADDDGGSARLLSEDEGNTIYPEFAPGGGWIVYCHQASAGKPYLLRKQSLVDGTWVQLSDTPAQKPRVSPDGKSIVADLFDRQSSRYRLGLLSTDDGDNNPEFPDWPANAEVLRWNPQGTGLTCAIRSGSAINVWNLPLDGGDAQQLTDFPPGHRKISDLSWNAAGDSMVVALETVAFDAVLLQRVPQ